MPDPCMEVQSRRKGDAWRDIDLVLGKYKSEGLRREGEHNQFIKLMEVKDLIRILPGEIPGFDLRTRRWGRYKFSFESFGIMVGY